MKNEIEFLQWILKKWDNSLELMNGADGEIYAVIQLRLKLLADLEEAD